MAGKYNIRNGIVTNNGDTRLIAPLLRLTAAGTVDLSARTMDYRVAPKLVALAIGQGGKSNAAGISVPVIVKGPWTDTSYRPDLARLRVAWPRTPPKRLNSLNTSRPRMSVSAP